MHIRMRKLVGTIALFVLVATWSFDILVGFHLKDERLAHDLGNVCRQLQTRVRGAPLVPCGPLVRRAIRSVQHLAIVPDAIPAIYPQRVA